MSHGAGSGGSRPASAPGVGAGAVAPARTALVVIDMQNDYCHPDGACNGALPFYDTTLIGEMIPVLQATVEATRAAGARVVWVRSEYSDWTASPNWERRGAGKPLPICRPGTWGVELHEAFQPLAEEPMFVKPRYSPFVGTSFELAMRARGIETLLITGVTTNVCVESTARDAFMRDFEVIALSDCAASYATAPHESAMWNIAAHFGSVLTSRELLALWELAPRAQSV